MNTIGVGRVAFERAASSIPFMRILTEGNTESY